MRALRMERSDDQYGSIFKLRFTVPADYLGPVTVNLQVCAALLHALACL